MRGKPRVRGVKSVCRTTISLRVPEYTDCPATQSPARPVFARFSYSAFTLSCFHEIVYTELYRTHMKSNLVRLAAVPYIISVVYLCASIAHMWALNGTHLRGSSLLRYCTQYKYALSKQDLKAIGLRYNIVTKNNVLVKLFYC